MEKTGKMQPAAWVVDAPENASTSAGDCKGVDAGFGANSGGAVTGAVAVAGEASSVPAGAAPSAPANAGAGGTTSAADRARFAPVIFLHGFAQTPRSWDAVAEALRAAGMEVCVPDLYAQVRPFFLDGACSFLEEGVRSVAREAGVQPVVVGYSMGGRIALETLARTPDLPLAALVLEGAGLGPADEGAREAFRARGERWARELREGGVAAFMDRWEQLPLFASQRDLPAEGRARIHADRMAHGAEELAQSCESAGQHCQACETDSLAAIARATGRGVRVAYVHGRLDAKYGAQARRVAERVSAVRVEEITGAGHNAHLERPEAFARVVERVIREAVPLARCALVAAAAPVPRRPVEAPRVR